jgi:F-type H+-transporting ATPase subunit epsilon
MKTISLEIISPEKQLLKENAASVIVPGAEGELGFLPGHFPLLAALRAGDVRIVRENGTHFSFPIDGGLVQAMPDKVIIFSDSGGD